MSLFLFPAIVFGMRTILKGQHLAGSFVITIAFLIVAGAALTTFNTRHIIQVLPLLLVLAAIGWRQARNSGTSFLLLGFGSTVGFMAYVFLKLL